MINSVRLGTASRSAPEPLIAAGVRTPIGTAGHALSALTVDQLAAPLLGHLRRRSDQPVDEVILGNCFGPGGNPARVTALAAGLDPRIPAVTVDRQCGSGLEAVSQAAGRIATGQAETVLAGGAESASTAPWRLWPPKRPNASRDLTSTELLDRRYRRAPFAPKGWPDPEMTEAADELARRLKISRQRQDAWAAESHRRCWQSQRRGLFADEILPVAGLDRDERIRAGLDAVRLARFRPLHGPSGTATAANSCGVSDGAAALLLTVRQHLPTDAVALRIRSLASTADDPALPGLALLSAVDVALERAGTRPHQLQAVEITEAFASVVIAAVDRVELDRQIVCADGGAIGYGHPWGASGAVLLVRLLHRLGRTSSGSGLGLAGCAIGGGQGLAMVVERVQ